MKAIEKYVLLSTQQRARSRRRGRTNKLSNTRRRRKEEKEEEEEGREISFIIKIREGKKLLRDWCLEEKETYPRPSSSSSESGLNRSTSELETPVVISISTDSFFFDISVDDESSGVSRIQ